MENISIVYAVEGIRLTIETLKFCESISKSAYHSEAGQLV